jgi:ribonuclease HI
LCINCAEKKWKKKANLDLWQEFETKSSTKNIIFHWVKGHSGNIYNELVDKLAFKEASQILLIKNKNILQ